MLTPKKAFRYWYGIHLHFTVESYSVLKYGQYTRLTDSKYSKLKPIELNRFSWLASQFTTVHDLVYASLASELVDVDVRFAPKTDIMDLFYEYKSHREALSYNLRREFLTYRKEPLKQVIMNWLACRTSPEFILCIANPDELNLLYNDPSCVWMKTSILRLMKYRDFFNPTQFQMNEKENDNEATVAV